MNRTTRTSAFIAFVAGGLLAIVQLSVTPSFSQTVPPELVEEFDSDPRLNSSWSLSGPMTWATTTTAPPLQVVSTTSTATRGMAFWTGDEYASGTMTARIRLSAGRTGYPAKALLVFARSADGSAYRWVSLAAGAPGTIALGQTGTIGGISPRTFRTVRNTTLRRGSWYTVTVDIAEDGKVSVTVGTKTAISNFPIGTSGTAPASGQVGFISARSKISVDSLRMGRPRPSVTNCIGCHDGRNPNPAYALAPDVYTYWDGTWWDQNRGGTAGMQQGGHGDPANAAALTCEGASGCHDLTTQSEGHLDGVQGGRGSANANTFHLKAEFFTLYRNGATGEHAVQVALDNYCYLKCHATASPAPVRNHRHEADSLGPDGRRGTADDILTMPPRDVVTLGTHMTLTSVPLRMDSDLNSTVNGGTNFAPCVACHDPHGTSNPDTKSGTNRMVRMEFLSGASPLCTACHF